MGTFRCAEPFLELIEGYFVLLGQANLKHICYLGAKLTCSSAHTLRCFYDLGASTTSGNKLRFKFKDAVALQFIGLWCPFI